MTGTPSPTPFPTANPTTGVIDAGLETLGHELVEALRERDLDTIITDTVFESVGCDFGGIAVPPGCSRQSGISEPVIHVGVLTSEGMLVTEEAYRAFMLEYTGNLADAGDEVGGPQPAFYAAGTFDEPPGKSGLIYLLVTRISGPRPSSPVVPGPEIDCQALFVGVDNMSNAGAIRDLFIAPLTLFDPEGEGSLEQLASGLHTEWEMWPEAE